MSTQQTLEMQRLAAQIATSYIQNHTVATGQLGDLLNGIFHSLQNCGKVEPLHLVGRHGSKSKAMTKKLELKKLRSRGRNDKN